MRLTVAAIQEERRTCGFNWITGAEATTVLKEALHNCKGLWWRGIATS